jgi:putative DNA primase/helicase
MTILDDLKAKGKSKGTIEVIKVSDVEGKEKQWLWEHHLLRGALELTTGIPNIGKSQTQLSLIACVTAGLAWPDGAPGMKPANVIMLTAEDTLDQEVMPRLVAAGANIDRVYAVKCLRKDDKDRQFLLGEDLDALEEKMNEIGDVALITIDPITAYMGKIDSHKVTDVRGQLGPLKDFAERNNVAISAITHPPKASSQKAIDLFIGSQAFIAAGRLAHLVIKEFDDNGEETGRVFYSHAKWNPTVRQPTLVFTIEGKVVRINEKTSPINVLTSHVVWSDESLDMTADEAVRSASGNGASKQQRGKQGEVQIFLVEALRGGQPMPAAPIIKEATKRGFTDQQLRTARKKLGVIVGQISGGLFNAGWSWQFPNPPPF